MYQLQRAGQRGQADRALTCSNAARIAVICRLWRTRHIRSAQVATRHCCNRNMPPLQRNVAITSTGDTWHNTRGEL
jgi:hypothetical protein